MTETSLSNETPPQDKKLALEVEKLQVEIDVLRNPYRHPQFWGAVLLAAVSLSLAVGQYFRSNQEYVLAQIKAERLALDAERLEQRRSALEADLKALASVNQIRRTALSSVEAEFRRVQERLTSTRLTRDQLNREFGLLRQAVGHAKNATAPQVTMEVRRSDGSALKNGDTIFLGDQITITPIVGAAPATMTPSSSWSFDVDFKGTPTPPKQH